MNDPIKKLLAAASEIADRRDQRVAWVKQTGRAWLKATKEMDERLTCIVNQVSEEVFDRLFDAEQAHCDAILQQMKDAAERDRWPRHLHWSV